MITDAFQLKYPQIQIETVQGGESGSNHNFAALKKNKGFGFIAKPPKKIRRRWTVIFLRKSFRRIWLRSDRCQSLTRIF